MSSSANIRTPSRISDLLVRPAGSFADRRISGDMAVAFLDPQKKIDCRHPS
jgi:hypothetical protein